MGPQDNQISAIVTSPPFETSLGTKDVEWENARQKARGRNIEGMGHKGSMERYGQSEGQIGNLKSGEVSAVISSPPYISGGHHPDQTGAWNTNGRGQGMTQDEANYGSAQGQIGQLKAGSIDGILTSPPYAESIHDGNGIDKSKLTGNPAGPNSQAGAQGYGSTPGNLGNLKAGRVDGAITSPPFADKVAFADKKFEAQVKKGTTANQYEKKPYEKRGFLDPDYEEHAATCNLGSFRDCTPTYWSEVAKVYAECHKILKPGGILCVVVKSYVAKGKIVDLPGDTLKLLVHLGFEPVERIHAMLRRDRHEDTLFEGTVLCVKRRESFFRNLGRVKAAAKLFWPGVPSDEQERRLALVRKEKPFVGPNRILEMAQVAAYKGAGLPEIENPTEIKYEVVLFVRKP